MSDEYRIEIGPHLRVGSTSAICCSGKREDFVLHRQYVQKEQETDQQLQLKRAEQEREFKRLADIQHKRKRKYLFTQSVPKERNNSNELYRPKHGAYKDVNIRKQSFVGWESESTIATWLFAVAGFFFKGFSDYVECFQCGLIHKKWKQYDDPLQVHFKNKPTCPHIVKQFIEKGIYSWNDIETNHNTNHKQEAERKSASLCLDKSTDEVRENMEDLSLNVEETCRVCLMNPLQITVQPCGHFVMCESCCRRILEGRRKCPVCRSQINDVIKTYTAKN